MKKKNTLLCLLLATAFCLPFAACKPTALREENSFEGEAILEAPLPPMEKDETETPPSQTPPEEAPTVTTPTPPVATPPAAPVVKKAEYYKLTGASVNVRAGAGTNFAVLGSAEKGASYAVIGKTGNWYKTYYRGKTGYVSASYGAIFQLEKGTEKTEKVIEEGYKLLGVPYVYGAVRYHDGKGTLLKGFTAQKFDCSSLVQYVFYKGADKLLGVHTRAQVKQGKFVKRADLQRGDCIFFTNEDRQYNTGVERIGHVAIYLGEEYILHTASDYARIEKMSAKRWKFYVEARRFL